MKFQVYWVPKKIEAKPSLQKALDYYTSCPLRMFSFYYGPAVDIFFPGCNDQFWNYKSWLLSKFFNQSDSFWQITHWINYQTLKTESDWSRNSDLYFWNWWALHPAGPNIRRGKIRSGWRISFCLLPNWWQINDYPFVIVLNHLQKVMEMDWFFCFYSLQSVFQFLNFYQVFSIRF